jgi:hypothetical protein
MLRLARWISGFIALLVVVLVGYTYFNAHMAQRRAERIVAELQRTRPGDVASPELVKIFEAAEQTKCGEGSPAGCKAAMVDFHNYGRFGGLPLVPLAFFHADIGLDPQNRLLGYLVMLGQSRNSASITAQRKRPEKMKAFALIDRSESKYFVDVYTNPDSTAYEYQSSLDLRLDYLNGRRIQSPRDFFVHLAEPRDVTSPTKIQD